jgi:hypothetical protein
MTRASNTAGCVFIALLVVATWEGVRKADRR